MSSTRRSVEADGPDAVYEAVADARRLRVVRLLREADRSVTLTDLAVEIARSERAPDSPVTEAQVAATRLSLYHCHVPKLVDGGIAAYDPDAERVAMRDSGPIRLLESISETASR